MKTYLFRQVKDVLRDGFPTQELRDDVREVVAIVPEQIVTIVPEHILSKAVQVITERG